MGSKDIELAISVIKALTQDKGEECSCLWEIGANYFIRTVTFHFTGRLKAVTQHELWLEDAAWIADDGRFTQAVESGVFNEVEPYPSGRTVAVGRGSLIDAHKMVKELPRSQK